MKSGGRVSSILASGTIKTKGWRELSVNPFLLCYFIFYRESLISSMSLAFCNCLSISDRLR